MTVAGTWEAIVAWFRDHGAHRNLEALRDGATESALAALEAALDLSLPADLRASLAVHDGGGDFESYEYLGCDEIADRYRFLAGLDLAPELWWPGLVPFAVDSCGNLIAADARAGGTLVHVELQGPQGAFPSPGVTVAGWLAGYLDKLAAGELAVDDEGFVDEPITPPSVVATERLERMSYEQSQRVDELIESGDSNALIAYLDSEGIDVDRQASIFDVPILAAAAEHKQIAIARALLERGAAVDVGRAQGERTPLFWALWGTNIDIELVRLLLDAGADPNALTAYDGTPMHAAAMWSHRDAWELLLERGGDPSTRDANGRTALDAYEG